MEIEKKIEWLKPERVQKLFSENKSPFGINRMFIVGVGKNGVDCVLKCKHLTEKRFGSDVKKVRYLGIAEDKYLEAACCEGSVLAEDETIPIVPEEAVYKYLNNPARLPQYAQEWFDEGLKNYSPATPVYGMTKRQCGRIALFHNFKLLMKRVGDAIAAFTGSDKSVEIVITGNMGDAFFSGMFIDLAYIFKKLFDDCGFPVKINCYLFAADTALFFEHDQREQGNYFANTILSKNDLDKFQCLKKPFSAKYTSSFDVDCDKPPFTACFIAPAEKSYEYTLSQAAEKILNRMEILFTKDDDAERIMSYNMLSQNGPHDFRYLSYSVRGYEVPVGKMISYLGVKVFTLFNHSLNRNNVGQMQLGHYANQVTPDAKFLAAKVDDVPDIEFDDRINPSFSVRALKFSDEGAHEHVNAWLERLSAAVSEGAAIYLDEIADTIISDCESAKTDFTKGPFYALEIVKKCLAQLRVAIAKTNADISDMTEQIERSRNLERTAYMKLKTSALFVGKAVEQYLFELSEFAKYSAKLRTDGTLVEFYQDLYNRISDYHEKNLSKAIESFENIAVNRNVIIEDILKDRTEDSCVKEAFSVSEKNVTDKLDELVENLSEETMSKAFRESGLLTIDENDETALAAAIVSIVIRCFGDLLSMSYGDLCDFFGVKDAIRDSLEECIDEVYIAAPVSDDFALNRVICPKSTKQDDIANLRAVHKGMNFIWNGSVLNHTESVAQIKGGVQLDKFKDYTQWENMHYAYVNDSLKKHGIHIFS